MEDEANVEGDVFSSQVGDWRLQGSLCSTSGGTIDTRPATEDYVFFTINSKVGRAEATEQRSPDPWKSNGCAHCHSSSSCSAFPNVTDVGLSAVWVIYSVVICFFPVFFLKWLVSRRVVEDD